MKQTIEDKLVSKVSKGKLNTIHVSREEMADLVDPVSYTHLTLPTTSRV